MGAVTIGELQINTAVPIEDILEFCLEAKKDVHTVMRLEGTVSEENGNSGMFQPLDGSEITVQAGKETLFVGIVTDVRMTQEGKGFRISLDGVSVTKRLDYERKSRSFQDTGLTYKEVMQKALADTSEAWAKLRVEDSKIERPLYQLEETDWEFVRRLASHLGVSIIPSAASDSPGIYVGLPEGKTRSLGDGAVLEKVWIDRKNKSACRMIRCYENWEIGDKLNWDGREYAVTEKSCQLEKGILHFRYKLSGKETFAARRYENPYAAGLLLSASVLDTKEEMVKVKFDMDEEQPEESAYWYPWRPDAGNMMYCMPEKGEKIYIHMGDADGRRARAVCGVHGNGEGHPEMKPEDRYFTTADGKRMQLMHKELAFKSLSSEKVLEVELEDGSGINCLSNGNIVVSAKDDIEIKGKKVFLKAPKEISLVRKNIAVPAVINMCNGFDSVGAANVVKISKAGGGGFPAIQKSMPEKEQGSGFGGVEKNVIASTPGAGLQKGLEEQVGGTCVNRLAR